MANDNYDLPTVYDAFSGITIPEACDCGIPGLVAVKDGDGCVAGLLTPNDAQTYHNGIIEPQSGYVKVYHPVNGCFLGVLDIEQAQEYITFLTP